MALRLTVIEATFRLCPF